MRQCRSIGVAVMFVIATLAGHAVADEPAGGQPAAAPAENGGTAIIDTETSARREAEFERTPYLPQVFAHQWLYHPDAITTPEASGDDNDPARLTVAEAVHQALLHNPGVAAQRLTPLRQRQDVNSAEAIFDPILTGAVNKDRRKSPNSSALSGVLVNVNEDFNANMGFKKTLRTGGDFNIDFTNNKLVSNARFQGLVPQYHPELVFSLNQPLLRNFGLNFAYLLVDVTKLQSEAAAWTYRAQLADFVKRVV